MANSFGIAEVTLNNLGDSTHAINTTARTSVYQPLVARVTNHVYDSGANATTEALLDTCAVFHQKRHGEPWTLGSNKDAAKEHNIHKAASTPAVPTNTTVLFPNFDYTTFE
jgi:hypothetical protein